MNITEITEKSQGRLDREYNVECPQSEFLSLINVRVEELGSNLNIAGFRKGKVPADIVFSKYRDDIIESVIGNVADNACKKIIEQYSESILSNPECRVLEIDAEQDPSLKLSLKCEVFPEIVGLDLQKVTSKIYGVEIEDDDIDKAVDEIKAPFIEIKDNKSAIKKEDVVNITIINHKIDGMDMNSHPRINIKNIRIGIEYPKEQFLKGFSSILVGKVVGIHTVLFELPDDFYDENVRGKKAEFDIEVVSISRRDKEYSEDEVLKSYEVSNKDELRKSVATVMQENINTKLHSLNETEFCKAIVDSASFNDIPQKALAAERKKMMDAVVKYPEKGLFINQSDNDIERKVNDIALGNLKFELILTQIIKDNGFKADGNTVFEYAKEYFKTEKVSTEQYRQMDITIVRNIAVDYIISKINKEKHPMKYKDFKDNYNKMISDLGGL